MTLYQETVNQFNNLAKAAGMEIVKSVWDEDTVTFGTFTFKTRDQAVSFLLIIPNGYSAELLGPTNTVQVEVI